MTYLVIGQRNPPDNYRDEIGSTYNYQRRYWRRIRPGDRIIYHQPRAGQGRGMVYFGCGIVGEIQPDPLDQRRRNAEIMDYTSFPNMVPVSRSGRFLEPHIRSQVDMVGNAVREIDETTARRIIALAKVLPPWDWEDDSASEQRGTSWHRTVERNLAEALRKYDEKYATMSPERRKKSLLMLHRPSAIGKVVKQLHGHQCWVCGTDGFLQRNRTLYAEVHHVEEVHTAWPGVLGTENMIVVCPTCHRKLHFANVTVARSGNGWTFTINGECVYVAKRRAPQ